MGQHMLRYILGARWHGVSLIEMNSVSSLACDVFGQHKLRFILCPRFHWRSLVITSCDKFCVLAEMVEVWSNMLQSIFIRAGRGGFVEHML
jgi:hypothetical protein